MKIFSLIKVFFLMVILTGVIYPLGITAIAYLTLKHLASGGLIIKDDKIVGAKLIGQQFESPHYFWGRPSVNNYNPLPSQGSNLGPTSQKLKQQVEARKQKLAESQSPVPSELLFASGSGLDPHISVHTAYFQVDRIAAARNLEKEKIHNLIDTMQINHWLFSTHPYINVLELNLALDKMQ